MCELEFETKGDLQSHKLAQHVFKCVCTVCDFAAENESELERHIFDFHWNKQFKCEKCSFSTHSMNDYNTHMESIHIKVPKSILKKREVYTHETDIDEIALEKTIEDLNTLLNGSNTKKESKLISAVRNVVRFNKKHQDQICNHETRKFYLK